MDLQILVTLLLSTIFSLISFIVVTTAVDRKSKKMRDEMYKRSKKRLEDIYERTDKRRQEMDERFWYSYKKRSGK
ncbi:TPA: hypothetical protein ACGO2U_001983 [Streptococcus suis]